MAQYSVQQLMHETWHTAVYGCSCMTLKRDQLKHQATRHMGQASLGTGLRARDFAPSTDKSGQGQLASTRS